MIVCVWRVGWKGGCWLRVERAFAGEVRFNYGTLPGTALKGGEGGRVRSGWLFACGSSRAAGWAGF